MLNNYLLSTKFKHWLFGSLVSLLVVFGLVSIVYEDLNVSSDNIISNLTTENIGFYLHFSHALVDDANWQSVPTDLKTNLLSSFPDFFAQQNLINSLSAQEYAYVIFRSEEMNDVGWLVYWPQQTLPELADNLTAATSGNLLIIGYQAEAIRDKYFSTKSGNDSLLIKVWPGFSRPSDAPYAYVDFNNLASGYNKFNLSDSWRLEIYKNYIEIKSLEKSDQVINNHKNKQWLQSFSGENMFFYSLKADELIWLWQQNQSADWYKYVKKLQAMSGVNIEQELIKLGGYYDLVVSMENKKKENVPAWLISSPAEQKIHNLIFQVTAKILGYFNPQIKDTILPDKTVIKEFIATEQNVNFQTYNLSGQNIYILYFNTEDYIFYTLIDNRYVIGNDLKLLNRLITKAKNQVEQTICQDDPEENYSLRIGDKLYSFSYWYNKKQLIYRACY